MLRFHRILFALLLPLCGAAPLAHGADVSVVGLFPGKAVLVVDGGSPRAYAVGATISNGVKLVAATQTNATLEINGKKQIIALGEHFNRGPGPGGRNSVTLQADSRGHFMANGQINGGIMRLVVDTGATLVALPAGDAVRLGIDYKKGQVGYVNTANGISQVYRITLDRVKIGDVELNQVDASVHETGLTMGLLGMSFLNRTEMRRDGELMTLTKRF